MITVLIEMRDDRAAALQATLACLVPAAVDGLVRDVVVFDHGIGPNARRIADDAGCALRGSQEVGDVVQAGASEWLLLLEAGGVLSRGWIEAVTAHMRCHPGRGRSARFSFSRLDRWGLPILSRGRRIGRGVLAPRRLLAERFRIGMRLADLAATVPTGVLDARIVPAPRSETF